MTLEYEPNLVSVSMKQTISCLLLVLGLCTTACAQLSFDASGGYVVPVNRGSEGAWGGGIGAKYYLHPKMAVGVRVRTYIEKDIQEGNGLVGRLTAVTMPVMGTFVYQLTDRDLHPYVGMEAGIIRTVVNADLSFNGRQTYNDVAVNTTFGFAPKVGVGYDLTQGLTLIGEAIYNVGLGKDQAGDTQFRFQQSARFLTVHVGLSFTFGNRFDPNNLTSQSAGR